MCGGQCLNITFVRVFFFSSRDIWCIMIIDIGVMAMFMGVLFLWRNKSLNTINNGLMVGINQGWEFSWCFCNRDGVTWLALGYSR